MIVTRRYAATHQALRGRIVAATWVTYEMNVCKRCKIGAGVTVFPAGMYHDWPVVHRHIETTLMNDLCRDCAGRPEDASEDDEAD